MIYTSGSTGKPKGVPIKHESLTNLLWSMQRTPGIGVRDKILALTTISFDIACVEMLLPLICGGCVEILPAEITSDGTRMREVLESTDATIVQATPATWRMLLAAGWRARKRFRIWCGGEALAPQLARSLLERCAELWNCYGPTETAIYACFHRVLDPDEIAIGRPVANTQMYVLDEHLNPAPVGIAGELFIGGAGLSPGYHRRPELTQKSFLTHAFDQSGPASRLYRTGDSCRYWRDGSVEYLGRLDNQVKVRGYRIELGEIESVLARHSSVREVVAATRDDEAGNRKIVAYVVPTDAGIPPTAETLRDFLQETLPHYMVPAAFVLLARMPVSPNGKVDRKALHLATPLTRPTPIVATSLSCEEQRVLSIWQEFLSSPDVGLHDNFFDVGGDSILLVQMAQRLSREYGRDFSNMDLFQFPTIASFAGHVAGVAGGRDAGHGMDVPDLQDRAELRAGRLRRKQALKEQT
jgi:acyl-coenzyme A synthetase/AMP-(fatty) acid ligase/acyl carrier protein